jgi:hypothetical protein
MPETKTTPTEAKSRAQRETQANKTTRVKAKGIGKVVNIKVAQRSARALPAQAARAALRVSGPRADQKNPDLGIRPGLKVCRDQGENPITHGV